MPMSAFARALRSMPHSCAVPCSVTMWCTLARVLTTPAPSLRFGTMREMPERVVDANAMMGLPPSESEAPRMKSICPPTPE